MYLSIHLALRFLNILTFISMSLPNCSFGENDESICHSKIYSHGKSAILLITDISIEDIDLLVWRTGVRKRDLKTICLHHQKICLENMGAEGGVPRGLAPLAHRAQGAAPLGFGYINKYLY